MIALNNEINAARDATKTETSNVETFKSGDFGFLGIIDFAGSDRLTCAQRPRSAQLRLRRRGEDARGGGRSDGR
jgi:L-asparaginase